MKDVRFGSEERSKENTLVGAAICKAKAEGLDYTWSAQGRGRPGAGIIHLGAHGCYSQDLWTTGNSRASAQPRTSTEILENIY